MRILYGFLYKGFQGILKILIFDFTLFKKTGLDLENFRWSTTIQFPRFLTNFSSTDPHENSYAYSLWFFLNWFGIRKKINSNNKIFGNYRKRRYIHN